MPASPDRGSGRLVVRGAREHNLKDVSLDVPRDALVVFTGLSGSGKSSLAFDTIFAEGQRRYVESLSSYARQFLGQMDKPDVDFIEGLSPAVSIDQKSTNRNPRSTVGTVTEVYDYLRVLFARAGTPHCPVCGRVIARQQPGQIVDQILALDEGARFQVLAPVVRGRKGEYVDLFADLQGKGYSRARVDGVVHALTDPPKLKKQEKHTIEVVVDRLSVKASAQRRLTDSVETALQLGGGLVVLDFVDLPEDDPHRERTFSEHLACLYDDLSFEEMEPRSFSFNSPYGACPDCHGLGTRKEVDPELVITDPEKSFEQGVIAPWSSGHNQEYFGRLVQALGDALGLHAQDAVRQADEGAAEGGPARPRDRGARPLPQPLRPGAQLLHAVRRRHPVPRAAARRGRERDQPGALRGLHARGALPDLPRRAAQARGPGGHPRGPLHLRRRRAVDRGLRGVPAGPRARRPAGDDRRAGAQGGQRPAGLPARRRPGLPVAGPPRRVAVRRRGAADPARDPDRQRAGRRAVRPRRAEHRPAPARQPAAHRHPRAAARHGQHPHRRRARRGHRARGRLGGRHRPRRRRARRPGGRQRHGRGPAGQRGLAHRAVPLRAHGDGGAGDPAHRARPGASSRWSGRASTTCAT